MGATLPSMNTRSQIACAVAGLVGVVTILVAFIVADYFVPPKASWSPEQFADFYVGERDRIRAGIVMLLVATSGWATLIAVVGVQLRRIEGPRTVMTGLHHVTGTAVYVLLLLFCLFLGAAAFRADRDPQDIQLLHDVGWMMAFLTAPAFCLQAAAVGVATLSDTSERPVYPRWFGYLGLWVAVLLLPGTILVCFLTGPFAYHGIVAYWLALFTFGTWMGAMALAAYLAAKADVPEGAAPVTA